MFDMGGLQLTPDPSGRDELLRALVSFAGEDFSVRLPTPLGCLDDELAAAFNAAAATHERQVEQGLRLAEQARAIERERAEVALARAELARQTEQQAGRSRSITRYLTGVSSEQRVLLNNMLILARLLADDAGKHLSPKQIDYAQTIYSAGTQLLSLIDAILDLAKAEAGAAMPELQPERFSDLAAHLLRSFRQLAGNRKQGFDVVLAPDLPDAIRTDSSRLRQILWGLISHALTVVGQGGVTLRIAPAGLARMGSSSGWVEFSLTMERTGMAEGGIAGDGLAASESGSALNLVVCRELAVMLGGAIGIDGEAGKGVSYMLRLPLQQEVPALDPVPAPSPMHHELPWSTRAAPPVRGAGTQDYRGPKSRRPDDAVVLIAECNTEVASVLLQLVRNNGYQGQVVADLRELRAQLRSARPDAIILGMNLSGYDGWTVLDLLRHDPESGQLPVSLSYANGTGQECLQSRVFHTAAKGLTGGDSDKLPRLALAGLNAEAGRDIRRLLVIDAGERAHTDAGSPWRHAGIEVTVVAAAAEGLALLGSGNWDALVVAAELPDMSPIELMKRIMAMEMGSDLPVAMIGTAGEGTVEVGMLKRREGLEEVLAETTLFLHRTIGEHAPALQRTPSGSRPDKPELAGKKALVVDNDILDLYTVTGVLEQQDMIVLHAESGPQALEVLRANPDTSVVLLGPLGTVSDSYELIGAIRGMETFTVLPIIALTAGTVQENRERRIKTGASDYIDKPVNVEQLLSLLRAWLIGLR